jgi:hypothetical protein
MNPPLRPDMKFVFVCQAGRLEIQSMLLAASLKCFLRCEYQMVVSVPVPPKDWGRPAQRTLAFFQEAGARIVETHNRMGTDFPIGNKTSALIHRFEGDPVVVIDSDVMLIRPFDGQCLRGVDFAAKPADFPTYNREFSDWSGIYRRFGLELPKKRMRATFSGEQMAPYYQAGFVAYRHGTGLGQQWLRFCEQIYARKKKEGSRSFTWVEQVALPLAVEKLGVSCTELDETMNYPAHVRRVRGRELPYFCHYHEPGVIYREPLIRRLVTDFCRKYPPIREAMLADEQWGKLCRPEALIRAHNWARKPKYAWRRLTDKLWTKESGGNLK